MLEQQLKSIFNLPDHEIAQVLKYSKTNQVSKVEAIIFLGLKTENEVQELISQKLALPKIKPGHLAKIFNSSLLETSLSKEWDANCFPCYMHKTTLIIACLFPKKISLNNQKYKFAVCLKSELSQMWDAHLKQNELTHSDELAQTNRNEPTNLSNNLAPTPEAKKAPKLITPITPEVIQPATPQLKNKKIEPAQEQKNISQSPKTDLKTNTEANLEGNLEAKLDIKENALPDFSDLSFEDITPAQEAKKNQTAEQTTAPIEGPAKLDTAANSESNIETNKKASIEVNENDLPDFSDLSFEDIPLVPTEHQTSNSAEASSETNKSAKIENNIKASTEVNENDLPDFSDFSFNESTPTQEEIKTSVSASAPPITAQVSTKENADLSVENILQEESIDSVTGTSSEIQLNTITQNKSLNSESSDILLSEIEEENYDINEISTHLESQADEINNEQNVNENIQETSLEFKEELTAFSDKQWNLNENDPGETSKISEAFLAKIENIPLQKFGTNDETPKLCLESDLSGAKDIQSDFENLDEMYSAILKYMKAHFERSMILIFKDNALTPWRWDSYWNINIQEVPPSIELNNASIFKTAIKIGMPYHGHIAPSDINNVFFDTWNNKKLPKHVSLFPFKYLNKTSGLILGICNGTEVNNKASLLFMTELIKKVDQKIKNMSIKVAS